MAGVVEDIMDGTFFNDTAGVHDDDVVCHLSDNTQVMGNQHDRRIDLILELTEQVKNLCLNGNIQCGGRFVGDDQSGAAHQCHCDTDSLTHTAGQLMGVHLIDALSVRNTNQTEHFNGTRLDLFLIPVRIVQFKDLVQLHADTENRVQGGHRFLEDHRDLIAADLLHDVGRSLRDIIDGIAIVEANLTFNDLTGRTLDQLHQRKAGDGLAAAGLADDTDGLADRDVEGDAVDRLTVPISVKK